MTAYAAWRAVMLVARVLRRDPNFDPQRQMEIQFRRLYIALRHLIWEYGHIFNHIELPNNVLL